MRALSKAAQGTFEELVDGVDPRLVAIARKLRKMMRVTGECTDWQGHSPVVLKAMKDNLERLKRLGVEAIDD